MLTATIAALILAAVALAVATWHGSSIYGLRYSLERLAEAEAEKLQPAANEEMKKRLTALELENEAHAQAINGAQPLSPAERSRVCMLLAGFGYHDACRLIVQFETLLTRYAQTKKN